jgi:hypothetical protein
MNPLRGILRKTISFSIDIYALTGKSLGFSAIYQLCLSGIQVEKKDILPKITSIL